MENQKERIWLRLKLDLLPCIAQEVDRISLDYMESVEKVRAGDRLEYKNLVLKQANIRTRIEEFEKFYDKFYADYRIGYFEKLKLRLRKLLSPHIDVNKMIYLETQGIRKAEIMQRRAQSKERDSLSPNRNNDDSVSSKPSFITQQKLNGSSSSAQQSNLLNLQQQAKQMYQKKIQANSQQQAFMQLQEPNESQTFEEMQKTQQSFSNNLKNNQKYEQAQQAISPQRIDQIIQKPQIKSKATRIQNTSKSPTPVSKINQANANKNTVNNQPKTQSSSNFTAASQKNGTAQQKVQDPQQNQKTSVDELVFTIRMTKEDYLKYLQQKSQKNK
ncbi:hypothetical protein TTHERM_00471410 (macronuclear) [Tetrahymena thermophila SB210]|uniref:Uncharacterized protein n=1 Tax=Tetrahymena thermophila (strain SB210) TaxID=312017 RepID=I7LTJ5_TETTS|nr:hypothetical protein TTHERM_00471410 [Tetrahymena thermophila SB210]EAR85364.2 hypothetical protein TTHERM_00471410 [Tetrahymena thermophila SB210]|eukprot:XP_001033027.2 hypothetical protein TTHERM_00471410 [Tetrahymena thermophila SB210]